MSDKDKVQIANEIKRAEKNLDNADNTLKNYGDKFAKFRTYDGLSRGRYVNGRYIVWNDRILDYMKFVNERISILRRGFANLNKYKKMTEGLFKNTEMMDWAKDSMLDLRRENYRCERDIEAIITNYKKLMEEIHISDTRIQEAAQKASANAADKLHSELRF